MPRTDNMFDFIKQELVESRLFRFPENLHGRDAIGMARLLFASILALEILRHEYESAAQQYVQQSLIFGNFDFMRGGATDLANMVAVLANQDKFEDELKTKIGLYAPELQIKTYLRTFTASRVDQGDIRRFLLKLDEMLMVAGGDMHQARRIVADWPAASTLEQRAAWATISRVFMNHGSQLDIYVLVKRYFNF